MNCHAMSPFVPPYAPQKVRFPTQLSRTVCDGIARQNCFLRKSIIFAGRFLEVSVVESGKFESFDLKMVLVSLVVWESALRPS